MFCCSPIVAIHTMYGFHINGFVLDLVTIAWRHCFAWRKPEYQLTGALIVAALFGVQAFLYFYVVVFSAAASSSGVQVSLALVACRVAACNC